MPSDADLLREVFAVAKEYGLTIVSLKCGSIALHCARTPAESPYRAPSAQVQEVKDIAQQSNDEALPELRKRSKELFGHVKPDEVLLAMKGAL